MTQDTVKKVEKISVELIDPNPFQQRNIFDAESLRELANSIRARGLLTPIVVRPHPTVTGRFQLCAGERRLRAHKLLERKEIDAIVRTDMDDSTLEEMALIENVQREGLSPIEEANGYQRLLERYSGNYDTVVEKVGKSRQTIEKRVALLGLCPDVQGMTDRREITLEQAEVLLEIEDAAEQAKLAKAAARAKMDVNRLKGIVQGKGKKNGKADGDGTAKPITFAKLNPQLITLADSLERFDVGAAKIEDLQTLKAQLGALMEQIAEDVLPNVGKRLERPGTGASDEADEEGHAEA